MFDKFEVLENWKLSWDLAFLLLGVSAGPIFFDFSNYCPYVIAAGRVGTGGLSIIWLQYYIDVAKQMIRVRRKSSASIQGKIKWNCR